MADYRGLNYGLSNTNRDKETGIRYGVISIHEVTQAWTDSSEGHYPCFCVECGEDMDNYDDPCPNCGTEVSDLDQECAEASSFDFMGEGYEATQGGDDTDIFVIKSPFFTYAQFCSPCAPGACYLGNPLDVPHDDNKAYCFGHDWFDDGKAPYVVYSVETGEIV